MTETFKTSFPSLQRLAPKALETLQSHLVEVEVPAGQTVFRVGDPCQSYLLVRSGSVRVQMTAETGREIVLYRVQEGDTCILTTSCLLSGDAYSAEGITETPVQAFALPAATFDMLLAQSEGFREFVFQSYGQRISNLMLLVEEVAFGRIDFRLARFLLERGRADGTISGTHQDIAVELGTAREVISRQLKDFEKRGWVSLSRGRVALTDTTGLSGFAEEKSAL